MYHDGYCQVLGYYNVQRVKDSGLSALNARPLSILSPLGHQFIVSDLLYAVFLIRRYSSIRLILLFLIEIIPIVTSQDIFASAIFAGL
jgi:hypothetical protein